MLRNVHRNRERWVQARGLGTVWGAEQLLIQCVNPRLQSLTEQTEKRLGTRKSHGKKQEFDYHYELKVCSIKTVQMLMSLQFECCNAFNSS